jgi:hypothetical protein
MTFSILLFSINLNMSSLLTSVIDELQASLYILVHNVTLRFKIKEKELDVKVKDGLHEIKKITYTRFIMKSLASFNIIVGSNNLYSHKQGGQKDLVFVNSNVFQCIAP